MAKTRLNNAMRDTFINRASKAITFPELEKAADEAYAAAATLVKAAVQAKFPPREMKVLKKYDVARADRCIRCADLDTARVLHFNFEGDDAPTVPSRFCSTRSIGIEADTTAAIEAHDAAADALRDAKKQAFGDLHTLAHSARYVEDVLEAWPEAKDFMPAKPQQAELVSVDAVERVRKLRIAA